MFRNDPKCSRQEEEGGRGFKLTKKQNQTKRKKKKGLDSSAVFPEKKKAACSFGNMAEREEPRTGRVPELLRRARDRLREYGLVYASVVGKMKRLG